MADELLAYRDRFPTLRRGPYFAAHTLGPMPDTAPEALARFTAEWADHGVVAWHGWLEQIRATAALLEGLFGAPAGSVALGPNVSVLAGHHDAGLDELLVVLLHLREQLLARHLAGLGLVGCLDQDHETHLD